MGFPFWWERDLTDPESSLREREGEKNLGLKTPSTLDLGNWAGSTRFFVSTCPSSPRGRASKSKKSCTSSAMANNNTEVEIAEKKLKDLAHSEQHYFNRSVSCPVVAA